MTSTLYNLSHTYLLIHNFLPVSIPKFGVLAKFKCRKDKHNALVTLWHPLLQQLQQLIELIKIRAEKTINHPSCVHLSTSSHYPSPGPLPLTGTGTMVNSEGW